MLTPREQEVLNTIVINFLKTKNPIGSRTVAKRSTLNLSAASIRNIMADLSEKGYLRQPHTSAGRVPTGKAIRLYITKLFTPAPFSHQEKKQIENKLKQNMPDLEKTLSSASKLLSSVSEQVSLVLSPQKKLTHWKQIDFMWIKPGLVLSILVLEEGLVQNKIIQVNKDITKDDLIKFSNFLNEKFKGLPLYIVRQKILEEMQQAHAKFENLYQKAMQVAQKTFDDNNRKVFVEGTINILDKEQIKDIQTMKELFHFLEEKSRLLEILDKTIEENGLSILIGEEDLESLEDYSVVSCPYSIKDEAYGVVSVIGPIYMNYPKIIPRVDLISKVLTEIFQEFY
ncbi:heat-inducible transcription repressor HrcA [Desulfonauticus submarinus]|uniref:Heat-inducible transcription repressor HrcA n=1 Tax=Desulfonauticus submarinus TaxID=206665 RepID=A0A1H0CLA7_9BACT|nr:heat-inducible transcriptional repressor HrcA [Desulfonauticus submarinus]SDN58659.1 heat-inducible transcription repressor HrcA [Desulfonauticus submarinus]